MGENQEKWDCFLSHSWGNNNVTHNKVRKICQRLKANGYKPWLDEEQLNDDYSQETIKGLDNSTKFIIFVTKDYLNSLRNKERLTCKEYRYAVQHYLNNIILVVLDEKYLDNKSWKGTILNFDIDVNTIHVDFSSEEKVEENFQNLCARIGQPLTLKSDIQTLIESGRKVKYNKSKLMFLGNGGVGKTSTLRNLIGKSFKKEHDSTNVAECEKDIYCDVNLDVWTQSIKKHEDIFKTDLKTLALTAKKTNKDIENIKIYNFAAFSKEIEELEVESDTSEVEEPEEIFEVIESASNTLVDTQVKKHEPSKKLSIWDFGGQEVFYTLHPLYLTSAGLCVVVFNMANLCSQDNDVKREETSQLRSWLESLNVYAKDNKVFIVGTRCEDVQVKATTFGKINDQIKNIVKSVKLNKGGYVLNRQDSGNLLFFPIENSPEFAVDTEFCLIPLKKAIIKVLEESETKTSTWNSELPLSWVLFMSNIFDKGENITSLAVLKEKGKENGFKVEEIEKLIDFFSKAGAILDFSTLNLYQKRQELVNSVVLRPSFLLKALGRIIYDENLHSDTIEEISDEPEMTSLCDVYKNHGILGSELLNAVWMRVGLKKEEILFLKQICEKMLIFSELTKTNLSEILELDEDQVESNETFYLVPAMSKNERASSNIEAPVSQEKTEGYIKWNSKVPQGLYERVICSCFTHTNSVTEGLEILSLTRSSTIFAVLDVRVELRKTEKFSKISVTVFSKNKDHLQAIFKILEDVGNEIRSHKLFGKLVAKVKLGTLKSKERKFKYDQLEWVHDCFLSHNWGYGQKTHKKVIKIRNMLGGKNMKAWIDSRELSDRLGSKLVKSMDESAAFVAFLTKEYMRLSTNQNSNAGKEFNYIRKRGCEYIIPVVLDTDLLKQSNWLGTGVGYHVTDHMYIDFTTDEKIKENLDELCERILKIKKTNRRVANMFSQDS